MSKREAAIVAAYTGYLIGSFDEMHTYIEEILKRPVFTSELGDPVIKQQIHEASRADFVALTVI